jgi:hypothetical protein
MPRVGPRAHVGADLRQQNFGGAPLDADDGAQQRQVGGERAQSLDDLGAQARDGPVEVIEVPQQLAQQQAVVGAHPPGQRLHQGRPLRAQPPLRQGGQRAGIGLAGDDAFEHQSPAHPEHIGDDGRELDICVLQHLLHPIRHARPLATRCRARRFCGPAPP